MATVPLMAFSQDFDSLLQRVDTIENPVYKPVMSISYGMLNFRGGCKEQPDQPGFR